MSLDEAKFLAELRATFKVEAGEHMQTIATGLLQLEKAPAREAQEKIVETVFRAAHSLKGAARAVNYTEIESTCQMSEDILASWKEQRSPPSLDGLDALHRALNTISATLAAKDTTHKAESATPSSRGVGPLSDGSARSEMAAAKGVRGSCL